MRSTVAVPIVFGAGLLLAACADQSPIAPAPVAPPTPGFQVLPSGSQVVEGVTGPGALYALFRPPVWNGELVLYAHGYRDPALPPALPDVNGLPDLLLGMGFGLAYSSFAETGFAVKDGAIRTHQLPGIYAAHFGPPRRTYVAGHSLGGMISLYLTEKFPGTYAGALPLCTFVGGSTRQIEYVSDVRAVFDVHFPGVIRGNVLEVPRGLDFVTAVQPPVLAALSANPGAAASVAHVDQIRMQYGTPAELATAILRPLFYQVAGTNDLLERTHGHTPVDNTGTVYTGSFDDALLNARIQRYVSAPDAERYLENYYEPSGKLKIPVLTMHTTADPDLPFFHEALFAARVAAAGSSDNLVQRSVDRFGHCNFTLAEHLAAFSDLLTWVHTGVRPAP